MDLGLVAVALPTLLVLAYFFERFLLRKLLAKFNRIKEYLFLLYCLVFNAGATFCLFWFIR